MSQHLSLREGSIEIVTIICNHGIVGQKEPSGYLIEKAKSALDVSSSIHVQYERSWAVEASLSVLFSREKVSTNRKLLRYIPSVHINGPSSDRSVAEAHAFSVLFTEVVALGALLEAVTSRMFIVEKIEEA
jgi:hypothetical protein